MKIIIKKSKLHGQGVFATSIIYKNEVIEICPVLLLNQKDTKIIDSTNLYNYYFGWKNQASAIALGYGSIYNHSYQPNARYKTNYNKKVITFTALYDIFKGEEILVNYNGDPASQQKVWFDQKPSAPLHN